MNELPKDLTDQGWKLIVRAPGRMFAVSPRWGGTVPSTTVEAVIRNARAMMAYLRRREAYEQRRSATPD